MSRRAYLAVSAALTAFLLVLIGAVGSSALRRSDGAQPSTTAAAASSNAPVPYDVRLRARDEALANPPPEVAAPSAPTFVLDDDDDHEHREHREHGHHHHDEDDDG